MPKEKNILLNHKQKLCAVCFDYRGTLLDHNSDRDLVAGMENLLAKLKDKKILMGIVFAKTAEELENLLFN
jgi:hydroxymethylpyrimidine pyrophosphatase-like HAD family hydrolase